MDNDVLILLRQQVAKSSPNSISCFLSRVGVDPRTRNPCPTPICDRPCDWFLPMGCGYSDVFDNETIGVLKREAGSLLMIQRGSKEVVP